MQESKGTLEGQEGTHLFSDQFVLENLQNRTILRLVGSAILSNPLV